MSCITKGDVDISRIYKGTDSVIKVYKGDTLIFPCYSVNNPTKSISYYLHREGPSTLHNLPTYIGVFSSDVTYWIEYNIGTITTTTYGSTLVYSFYPNTSNSTVLSDIANDMKMTVYDSDGTTELYSEDPLQNFYWYENIPKNGTVPTKRYIKLEYNYPYNYHFYACLTSSHTGMSNTYGSCYPGETSGFPNPGQIQNIYTTLINPGTSYEQLKPVLDTTLSNSIIFDNGGILIFTVAFNNTLWLRNDNNFEIHVLTYSLDSYTLYSNQTISANSESAISFSGHSGGTVIVYPTSTSNKITSVSIKDV